MRRKSLAIVHSSGLLSLRADQRTLPFPLQDIWRLRAGRCTPRRLLIRPDDRRARYGCFAFEGPPVGAGRRRRAALRGSCRRSVFFRQARGLRVTNQIRPRTRTPDWDFHEKRLLACLSRSWGTRTICQVFILQAAGAISSKFSGAIVSLFTQRIERWNDGQSCAIVSSLAIL